MEPMSQPQSLAEILKRTAGLSEETLEEARRIRAEKGGQLGEILLRRKSITEAQLLEALSALYDLPFWPRLPASQMESDIIRKVPIQFLKRYAMVPFPRPRTSGPESESPDASAENGRRDMVIAVNNPAALQPLDDLARLVEADSVEVVLSYRDAILAAINIAYDLNRDSAEQLVQDMEENDSMIISDIEGTADLLDDTSDAPIIKLVNHIISQAAKARASDIHIEPYQERFKVRYRVDGILYDLLTPPKSIQAALISRIKVMSNMNIAEKRLPQDGRLQVKIGDQDIDVRISTIPTSFGERVVLRLLNKRAPCWNCRNWVWRRIAWRDSRN
jgi:general secretion pathway protein E